MNKLQSRETYNRYYGDFRGVDFSSDHTQVLESRLAYSVNMYKDYNSGQGKAIETIPGFRRRFETGEDEKINAIHFHKCHAGDQLGIVIHAGTSLYQVFEEKVEKIETYNGEPIEMNNSKSVSFYFGTFIYFLDGEHYIRYGGMGLTASHVTDYAYTPTTYINIMPSGENANAGEKYEERNLLSPYFRNTFFANGSHVFKLSENNIEVTRVKIYNKDLYANQYTVDRVKGTVTINDSEDVTAPDGVDFKEYAGIEITAKKRYENQNEELINKCTLVATFDDRIFVSGNPSYPNTIYYCGRNASTGTIDPTYFPINNYVQAGVGLAPITGLVPVADTLMVLKSDTLQDGSIYYLTGVETGDDLMPKIYKTTRGLAGLGCQGPCINFLDDPVFISKLGLEGVGQLSVRLERAIEHRSSLIDAKLTNFTEEQLKNAVLEEWNGYLMLLIDGNIFMADSRQRYADSNGIMQYEWYYLEGIGVYDGQWDEYVYESDVPSFLIKEDGSYEEIAGYPVAIHENANKIANPDEETKYVFGYTIYIGQGIDGEYIKRTVYVKIDANAQKSYLCRPTGRKIGGTFKKATTLKSFNGNLFFGTENGIVCSFNFDKRVKGEIPIDQYTFDGRTIISGAAIKMDNCGIPHLAKSTVKKSTVIKTRSFASSALKVKVRTNKTPYTQIARINTNTLDFDHIDFADFSFLTEGDTIFAIKEKEKQWVEKQYYVFSDEFRKPFSLHYISYRYFVSGRVKL